MDEKQEHQEETHIIIITHVTTGITPQSAPMIKIEPRCCDIAALQTVPLSQTMFELQCFHHNHVSIHMYPVQLQHKHLSYDFKLFPEMKFAQTKDQIQSE